MGWTYNEELHPCSLDEKHHGLFVHIELPKPFPSLDTERILFKAK